MLKRFLILAIFMLSSKYCVSAEKQTANPEITGFFTDGTWTYWKTSQGAAYEHLTTDVRESAESRASTGLPGLLGTVSFRARTENLGNGFVWVATGIPGDTEKSGDAALAQYERMAEEFDAYQTLYARS